ncbi:pseudaminic acid synthase [Vampirovibrio chlorellavorus]|uniref:pseudaminic acid synthase n=1 Tax=Vampirovibrio chlorellavorus TaxID=758823 RepID=UPI0026F1391E|nr:pseudaminic acid synthase [Vampirovibrio chlorellavorus]
MSTGSNQQNFQVGTRPLGPDHPPLIIAEMSGNHNGSLEKALAIVDAVAEAGADALKIQTYTADTMTLDLSEGEFFIEDPTSLWKGESLYNLYQKAHTSWDWHQPIFDRCREKGLIGFSSPFDATAVDFLQDLNVPLFKIASFEIVDIPLIRKVAATGKPTIMSTGLSNEQEVAEAVEAFQQANGGPLILLKCTSSYPADPKDSNLRTIPFIQERFGVYAGLSDHTLGTAAAVASVALGAVAIEKHVTLSRAEGGVDSAFSMEPDELKRLVDETRLAHRALGGVGLSPTENERKNLVFRRSLYVTADIAKGETLTPQNIRAIRPGLGLPPKHWDAVLGKRAKTSLKRGTPLAWNLIETD